jgi:hypothetical protein
VQRIAQHLGIDPASCLADVALSDETDLARLASRIGEAVPKTPGTSSTEAPRPGGMISS